MPLYHSPLMEHYRDYFLKKREPAPKLLAMTGSLA
jgi:hypothetical protein